MRLAMTQYSDCRQLEIKPMAEALRLARRGYGTTSPNPMVGAVLVKRGKIIGRGWHRRAGGPHAEIEALADARQHGHRTQGATLYVTLEPCSTQGRTPPCTGAIISAGIRRVIVGATDPNPKHRGRGFRILRRAGVEISSGVMARECRRLNEAFNQWITRRTPFVTVKAAMTLDGKIATAAGESKWITGEPARQWAMNLRRGSDAIVVGVNTVLLDDPSLTVRSSESDLRPQSRRRVVLDSAARTPLNAKVVSDEHAADTTIVVSRSAPKRRVAALARKVKVLVAPTVRAAAWARDEGSAGRSMALDLRWLLRRFGKEDVTSVLVEGGGEVNASFLLEGLAHRIAFFYAPKILGGREARRAVAGDGARCWGEILSLKNLEWRRVGPDLLLTAEVDHSPR